MALLFIFFFMSTSVFAQQIFNLDKSETVVISENGFAQFKILADFERGTTWVPKAYEPKLYFSHIFGEYVFGEPDYQLFTVQCVSCKAPESFMFEMRKITNARLEPGTDHIVIIQVVK